MIATYPEADFKNMPRLGLVELSQWLCLSYSTMRGSRMAAGNLVEAAIRILRNLGYNITRTGSTVHVDRSDFLLDSRGVWGAMHAARACFVQNDRSGYDQYRLLAKELYLTSYGEMRGLRRCSRMHELGNGTPLPSDVIDYALKRWFVRVIGALLA